MRMKHFKYAVTDLINGIRERPALWDKTLDKYKDREERRVAWEQIFRELDEEYDEMSQQDKRTTADSITCKWTNIRDTFIKSLRNQANRSNTRRYVYHDEMSFLLKVIPQEIIPDYAASDADEDPISCNMKQEMPRDESEGETSVTKETKRSRKSESERSTNFNKDETLKLICLLKDYPILTSKKTDHASNLQKDAAWRSLAQKFNSDAVIFRNIKQLQQKFNNMKKTARKELSAKKSGRRQTGDGPPSTKPSETTVWLNTIMGESITCSPAIYDNDELSDGDPSVDIQDTTSSSNALHFMDDGQSYEEKADINECDNNIIFDSSTPKALLRKPKSRQLSACSNKRKIGYPVDSRRRIISHLDAIYAQEEHRQNMQEKKELHQKRITLIEEKHSLYLEQQKELHTLELEFKKKAHELLLEKTNLEIDKLKSK